MVGLREAVDKKAHRNVSLKDSNLRLDGRLFGNTFSCNNYVCIRFFKKIKPCLNVKSRLAKMSAHITLDN